MVIIATVLGYTFAALQVKYRRHGHDSSGWKNISVESNQKYTISRLQPDTVYDIVVVPDNIYGQGFESQLIQVATKGEFGKFGIF